MFSAGRGRLWTWLSGQEVLHDPGAEPASAPSAPPHTAALSLRADPAGDAAGTRAPSPLRHSPCRPQAPAPSRQRPLLGPEGRNTAVADSVGTGKAPQEPPPSLRPLKELRAWEGLDLSERLRELGVPTGPWAMDEDAKAEINLWARNRKAGGGGFAVVWGNSRAPVTSGRKVRGRLHTLICHNHGEANGKCGWSLTLEECKEGWAIRSYHPHAGAESSLNNGHNHALIGTAVEAQARRSMREIPADLVEVGKALVHAGVSNTHVFRFLVQQVEKRGEEVMFNMQDVYHACGASTSARRLDATNLVEYLREREVKEGLFQRTTTDEMGNLNQVFFALADAHKIYAIEPERQVVEIDHKVRPACTASTSRACSPLTRACCVRPARHQPARAQDDAVGHDRWLRRDQDLGV